MASLDICLHTSVPATECVQLSAPFQSLQNTKFHYLPHKLNLRNTLTAFQKLLGNGKLAIHAILLGHAIAYVLAGLFVQLHIAATLGAAMIAIAMIVDVAVAIVGAAAAAYALAWLSTTTSANVLIAIVLIICGIVAVAVVLFGHVYGSIRWQVSV